MNIKAVEKILRDNKQLKLLEQVSNFSEDQLNNLYNQLKSVPWDEYSFNSNQNQTITPSSISPSKVISLKDRSFGDQDYNRIGLEAYKNGEVAVLIVAGGQGTRLGSSSPKGCYKIGAVSGKSLYQLHAEKVLALSLRFGQRIPLLIMTSLATDAETRDFFKANKFFGLAEEQIKFFMQASIPSFDLDGNLLLSRPGELVVNPDGHGGCFTALAQSGLLDELSTKGIKHLIYIQVDNILAPIFDPYLLGLAVHERADVITKVVEKRNAEEKVGLLVSVSVSKIVEKAGIKTTKNENDTVKEYIELPKEILEEKEHDGRLKYRAGNTAMHYWNINFLEQTSKQGFKLPLHASKKPLMVWNKGQEEMVEGYKYERFIFDLIPKANVSLGLEVDRNREFAPLKNKTGNDSPETINQLTSELFKTWFKESGIEIPISMQVEISPLFAMNAETVNQTLSFDDKVRKLVMAKLEKKESIYLE